MFSPGRQRRIALNWGTPRWCLENCWVTWGRPLLAPPHTLELGPRTPKYMTRGGGREAALEKKTQQSLGVQALLLAESQPELVEGQKDEPF